jgi:hypothetical protein
MYGWLALDFRKSIGGAIAYGICLSEGKPLLSGAGNLMLVKLCSNFSSPVECWDQHRKTSKQISI